VFARTFNTSDYTSDSNMALRLAPSGVGHGRTGVRCVSALCAGDFVACPFLGSGTTAVASRQLGRRFVGSDVSEAEVATTKARLRAEGSAEGSRRARTRLYA
jgi:hypothetical protein